MLAGDPCTTASGLQTAAGGVRCRAGETPALLRPGPGLGWLPGRSLWAAGKLQNGTRRCDGAPGLFHFLPGRLQNGVAGHTAPCREGGRQRGGRLHSLTRCASLAPSDVLRTISIAKVVRGDLPPQKVMGLPLSVPDCAAGAKRNAIGSSERSEPFQAAHEPNGRRSARRRRS